MPVIKNKTTETNKEFWKHVEKVSTDVDAKFPRVEALIVTRTGQWAEVEILQWMERNTRVIMPETFLIDEHTVPLHSIYQSQKKINELLGIKEVLR
jgi:predicted DNA-binding transcriptional regulator AlpA